MFHVFFLVISLTTGQSDIGMSYETYPTMEACQAAMPARVADGNKRMKADEALLKIVGALCDTEEGFKAKLKASQQDNSI